MRWIAFAVALWFAAYLPPATAQESFRVLVFSLDFSDGRQARAATQVGQPLTVRLDDSRFEFSATVQDSLVTIEISGEQGDAPSQLTRIADVRVTLGTTAGFEFDTHRIQLGVTEMSLTEFRAHHLGGGMQAPCADSTQSASETEKVDVPGGAVSMAACCVTCDRVTVCGCSVMQSCGSCCTDCCAIP
jgi:hypothetical protein